MTSVELVLLPPASHASQQSADPLALLVLAIAIIVLAGGPWLELCLQVGHRVRPRPRRRPQVRGVI
jgi:hypothetical protein